MTRTRANTDFLNGVPELVILQLLSERPMYGYELVRSIRERAGETLAFGEGCVYPLLHKLEEQGSLASVRESVGGRSRVVYRATPAGKRRLRSSAAAWSEIVAAVGKILQGGEHVEPAYA